MCIHTKCTYEIKKNEIMRQVGICDSKFRYSLEERIMQEKSKGTCKSQSTLIGMSVYPNNGLDVTTGHSQHWSTWGLFFLNIGKRYKSVNQHKLGNRK